MARRYLSKKYVKLISTELSRAWLSVDLVPRSYLWVCNGLAVGGLGTRLTSGEPLSPRPLYYRYSWGDHILGSNVKRVLHTARVRNFETASCVAKKGRKDGRLKKVACSIDLFSLACLFHCPISEHVMFPRDLFLYPF